MRASSERTAKADFSPKGQQTPQSNPQVSSAIQFVDNRGETMVQKNVKQLADQRHQNSSPTFSSNGVPGLTESVNQLKDTLNSQNHYPVFQRKENNTGLPDQLKSGIENLSGFSMDDVKVHRNSDKPALLHAHAYAQGNEIHLAPGQEKHLPHEAWHVVQQKQGRVKPTLQMKGKVNVNDDPGLEKEADVMGQKAIHKNSLITSNQTPMLAIGSENQIQRKVIDVVQMRRNELYAWEIAFTQASIGTSFSSVPEGVEKRLGKLGAAADNIDKGEELPEWIQGLRVFSIKDPDSDIERIFSLDNRRLKVIKMSRVGSQATIPVQWADLRQVIDECFKLTNKDSWSEAVMTDMPSEDQRKIAPTGNLLGDFIAALIADGYINADGESTGGGVSNVVNEWNFNQAE